MWVSMLMETEDTENGGRPDYSLAEKIQDLESLRDAVAVTGWSSGHVSRTRRLSNLACWLG